MAPEQLMGEPPSPATDWYAVGVMAFETLVGEPPLWRASSNPLLGRMTRDPQPLARLAPGTPDALCEVIDTLVARDPRARARASSPTVVPRTPWSSRGPRPGLGGRFTGRERERESTLGALRRRAGKATVVRVAGPAGIGKTAFVERMVGELTSGDRRLTLRGQCWERESVPFKGIDGAMEDLVLWARSQHLGYADVVPEGLSATPLFPALAAWAEEEGVVAPEPGSTAPAELRRRAFAATKELLRGVVARTPAVLILEDVQWADQEGVSLLAEMLSAPDAVPLHVLYTTRDDQSTDLLAQQLESLPPEGDLLRVDIRLGPLPPEDARRLAARILWTTEDDEEAAAVARASGGMPFLLEALCSNPAALRTASDAGEAAGRIDRVLDRWLSETTDGGRHLLALVSAAVRPLPQRTVLVASDSGSSYEALAELRAMRLVRGHGARGADLVEPYHDLIREAVIARLATNELQGVHRRLADALVDHGRGRSGARQVGLAGGALPASTHHSGSGSEEPDSALGLVVAANGPREACGA